MKYASFTKKNILTKLNTFTNALQDGWYKIADSIEDITFNEKGIAGIKINGRSVCLIKTPEGVKACTDICPHAGSSLSQNGFMDNRNNIVCCVHHYRFSISNGRDSLNEGYFLKLYDTRIENGGVFIKL